MSSIETMRAILVACAAVAAIIAGALGFWPATAILLLGVVGHLLFWWQLRHTGRRDAAPDEV